MRRVAIVWFILAAVVAIVTTITNVEPASTFIGWFTVYDGSFYIAGPIGLTFLLFIAPLLLIMLMRLFIQNKNNRPPDDLTGLTGCMVHRQKELQGAAIALDIYVNGMKEKSVGMNKKVFIELPPGEHEVQVKMGKKTYSAPLKITLEEQQIIYLHTGNDLNKSLTSLSIGGEKLFLVKLK